MWYTGENKMIKGLIVGLQFLTRLPVNINMDFNEENIGRATFFFPLIGMLLGIISFIPYYFLAEYSSSIASFLVVFIMILLTGGLHLDGVSDMVDGFFSSRDRERTLEIMADSRIGAFGVLSLILLIIFKLLVISNFTISKNVMYALVFSMGNGRFNSLIAIAYKKMIKPGGMGDMIHSSNNSKFVVIGMIFYIIILILVNPIFLLPLLGAFITQELVTFWSFKKLGGVTGDIYGAVVELSEAISLLLFLGVLEWI